MTDRLLIKQEVERIQLIIKQKDVFRLREYLFHQRYENKPKVECTLEELVWAHTRYPRLVEFILDRLIYLIPDIRDINKETEEVVENDNNVVEITDVELVEPEVAVVVEEVEPEEEIITVYDIDNGFYLEAEHNFLLSIDQEKENVIYCHGVVMGTDPRNVDVRNVRDLMEEEVQVAEKLGLIVLHEIPELEYSSDFDSDELPPLVSTEEIEYSTDLESLVSTASEDLDESESSEEVRVNKFEEIQVDRYCVGEQCEYYQIVDIPSVSAERTAKRATYIEKLRQVEEEMKKALEPLETYLNDAVAAPVPSASPVSCQAQMDVEIVEKTVQTPPSSSGLKDLLEEDELLVKVVTSENMGMHLGPDLVDLSKIPASFIMYSSDSVSVLENEIARKFNLELGTFTLMAFTRRKNGTIRPSRKIRSTRPLKAWAVSRDSKEVCVWLIPNFIKKVTDKIVHLKFHCNKNLFYKGHFVVRRFNTVNEAMEQKGKKFTRVFEEVFAHANDIRIDDIETNESFAELCIDSGDILIYTNTDKISSRNIKEVFELYKETGKYYQ